MSRFRTVALTLAALVLALGPASARPRHPHAKQAAHAPVHKGQTHAAAKMGTAGWNRVRNSKGIARPSYR